MLYQDPLCRYGFMVFGRYNPTCFSAFVDKVFSPRGSHAANRGSETSLAARPLRRAPMDVMRFSIAAQRDGFRARPEPNEHVFEPSGLQATTCFFLEWTYAIADGHA
jgi:hypothetical protein